MHYITTKTLVPAAAVLLSLAVGCEQGERSLERTELLAVYKTLSEAKSPDAVGLKETCVDVREGITTLYVKTNVDIEPSWQDGGETPWVKVTSYKPSSCDGVYELEIRADRINSGVYYTRRSGTLLLSSPENNFGLFLKVHQGATARYSCNMSALEYGNGDPLSEDGIAPLSEWSSTIRQSCNFTSTPFGDGTESYLYGKKGYVRLGDADRHGADIITPYVNDLRSDSHLMVSFKAVAYQTEAGVKDNSKFKVEVLGGGVIADNGQPDIEFEAGYINPLSPDYPSDIWNGASWQVFVKSTATNPITADTRIRIVSGNLNGTQSQPSRLFVDDIYVRRLVPGIDQDYYRENNGSGPDIILGQ